MSETIRWWLILQVVGMATLPLCLLMFRQLPDRGYALSKPFGLILLGFTFWFFSSHNWIAVLPNSPGGILGALFVLLLIAAACAYSRADELIEWVREHWRYILAVEALLFVVFAVAVSLRSTVGQISGTEQPMDLMFLNSTIRAEHFPPEDPWLAGHTVAYYYFGYLIVGIVTQLSGVPADVGYNIGLAMIAALAFVGAFGIVYNLVQMRETSLLRDKPGTMSATKVAPVQLPAVGAVAWKPAVFAFAGGLLLVIMGNLAWVFVFASTYGIGGSGFYDWVDISGLTADEPRDGWYPSDFFGFFNASRIYPVNDEDFRVITEFPMFSFLLGDLHPHVMALPFVLLVVALALTLFRSEQPLDITFWLKRPLLLVGAAIMLGGLAFINTWDIATMAFVVVIVALITNFAQMRAGGAWDDRPTPHTTGQLSADALLTLGVVGAVHMALLIVLLAAMRPAPAAVVGLVAVMLGLIALFGWYLSRPRWPFPVELGVRTVTFALPLLLLAIDLYLPFYTGFSSQADGIGAVVTREGITYPGTRPFHLLVFWSPLFAVVLPFVVARFLAVRDRLTRREYIIASIPGALVVIGWAVWFAFQNMADDTKLGDAGGFFTQIGDRGAGWITAIFLAGALTVALATLWGEVTARSDARSSRTSLFALMLTSTALLLILGTEFFYVGDVFNNRMNTVFKLYYQAWLLLALAAGFALYYLASTWRFTLENERRYRIGWGAAAAVVLLGAALYPLGGTWNRTDGDPLGGGPLLHGLDHFSEGERAGIDWLNDRADGQHIVIAEAVGDDYTLASRISAATGIPTIIGWVGHENQWRGSSEPYAGRFEDVSTLYTTTDAAQARQILEKYGVTYVYVGQFERQQYEASGGLAKFEEMPVMFQAGEVTIYRATGLTGEAEAAQ
jgi:YYY domain-containing protein